LFSQKNPPNLPKEKKHPTLRIHQRTPLHIFLLLIIALSLQAQEKLPFQYLNTTNGLANNICYKVFTDSKGTVWVGTQNGLSRYLGNGFKNYLPDSTRTGNIKGLIIKDIIEDPQGYLWIAAQGGGLNRYDPRTDQFVAYQHSANDPLSLSNNDVTALCLDKSGRLWVGTFAGGLNLFDQKTGKFQNFPLTSEPISEVNAFGKNSVSHILQCEENPDLLWLAGNHGIYRFDTKTLRMQHFPSSRPYTQFMSVHHLLQGPSGYLWAATYGAGVTLFRKSDATWEYFPPHPEKWEAYSSRDNIMLDMTYTNTAAANEIWVASLDQGLGLFNTATKTYRFFKTLQNDEKFPSVNAVTVDKAGRLWVANHERGLAINDPQSQAFQYALIKGDLCMGNQYNQTTDFAEDQARGLLYVTTTGCNGFYVFEKKNDIWQYKQSSKLPDFPENSLYCVEVDASGRVWVGGDNYSWSGGKGNGNIPTLSQYFPERNQLVAVKHPTVLNLKINKHRIRDITADASGNVWIATDGLGLVQYNPILDDYLLHRLPNSENGYQTNDILADKTGKIWMTTTENGLFCFNPQGNSFKHYNNFLTPKISCIGEDIEGNIWVGLSGKGVQIVHPNNDTAQKLTVPDASNKLPFPTLTHIESSPEGDLWLTTETGLCRYDKEGRRFELFDQGDGLSDAFYFGKGFTISKNGNMFIGQDGGFCYRTLSKTKEKTENTFSLLFTDLKTRGEFIDIQEKLTLNQTINLKDNENTITIRFALLDYTRPEKVRYLYQMEGIDNILNSTNDSRGEVTYHQLPPGNYKFKVIAADHEGNYCPAKIMQLHIAAPWWASWWAYLVYAILLGYLLNFLWKNQLKRTIAQEEARRLRDLDEQKTRLYGNITHEFRTPLTLLLGPTERVLSSFEKTSDEEVKSVLQSVRQNGQRLLNLVNQILDIRQREYDYQHIYWENGDVMQVIEETIKSFQPLSKIHEIKLVFHADTSQLMMDFDRDKLEHILQNLLSNALKFTPKGGLIAVNASIQPNDELLIKISDNGVGIHETELPHVFNRFYQASNQATNKAGGGTGIGLALVKELVELLGGRVAVESCVGKGTTFFVRLPQTARSINPARFSAAEDSDPNQSIQSFRFSTLENIQPETIIPNKFPMDESTQSERPSILIIEDNPEIATYIGSCLGNYEVSYAENGRIGLEKAFDALPDLVICDWMMPEKDGLEVCQTLKDDECSSHIPIIMLTARASIGDRVEGLRRGADVYLSKPFVEEELRVQVEQLLRTRQLLAEKFAQKIQQIAPETSLPAVLGLSQKDVEIEDAFLQKTLDCIRNNVNDTNLNVEKLGLLLNISHSQLHRKLSSLLQKTPTQIIRECRLEVSKKLLLETELTVAEVAYKCGFEDASYFTRVFTKEVGQSPKVFAQRK
jgi:signal transduction histidine kinase/ligand-binding sensor domain-containing protein/DNA-binding response OmpR family regulator